MLLTAPAIPAQTAVADASRIVVSATRSAQSEWTLPASVDRIDATEALADRARLNLSEALAAVPGLRAESRQNQAQDLQLAARGFGARTPFGVRGLRLYSDGIPATMPDGQGQVSHFDLGSADSIEVLRGPFAVLYGNAAGGVITMSSERGDVGMQAEVDVEHGSYGTRREALKLKGEMDADSGSLNYLLSASQYRSDGYRDHSRASRAIVNAVLRADSGIGKLTLVANTLDMPDSQDPQGLTEAQWRANPRQAAPSALQFNTRKRNAQQQLGLHWELPLGEAQALEASAWGGQRQVEQFQSIPTNLQNNIRHPGGVIALDRAYGGLDLRWSMRFASGEVQVGASRELMNEARKGYRNSDAVGTLATLGTRGDLRRDEDNDWQADALYAQLLWSPLPDWHLLAGLRRSIVRVDSRDRFIVGANGDDSGDARHAATTPALGLSYTLLPGTQAYAAWGEGFEAPTGNELAYRAPGESGLNFALRAARSAHREIGLKSRLGGAARLTLARFAVATRDEIAQLGTSNGRAWYGNVGRTERKGWELAWRDRYFDALTAQLAWTRLDARYRDSSGNIAAGNTLPGTGRTSLYGELAWMPAPNWRLALEGRQQSRLWANDANSAFAPGYRVANLSLSHERRFGTLRARAFARIDNVDDKRYVGSVIVNDSNERYFEPAPGRNQLVGVSLEWML